MRPVPWQTCQEVRERPAGRQRVKLRSPLAGAQSTGKNRQTGQTQGQQRQSRAVIRDGNPGYPSRFPTPGKPIGFGLSSPSGVL